MKYLSILSAIVLTSLMIQIPAQAQMIDYKRREKRADKKIGLINKSGPSDKAAAKTQAAPKVDPILALMRSNPEVTNRIERLYDSNRDGYLQESEIRQFYSDVVASVERRGQFRITSALLSNFDQDNDGELSLREAVVIRNKIN